MNKTPKSKAKHKQCFRFDCPEHGSDNTRLRDAIFGQPKTDIISRMEAAQQRFGRLQLTDTPPEPERAFDAEDIEEWQRRSEEQGAK